MGIWSSIKQKLGIYAEGRYTWAEDNDSAQVRSGIRIVF